jgi:hypothetical protein
MIGVVLKLGFTPERIGDPHGARLDIIAELKALAIAGPKLNFPG